MRKNGFYIFVPSDDLWPFELKFSFIVTLVQRYVYTKLEVCGFPILKQESRAAARKPRDAASVLFG